MPVIGANWILIPAIEMMLASLATDIVDGFCVPYGVYSSVAVEKTMAFLILFIGYILPLALMIFCYSRIVYTLRTKVTRRYRRSDWVEEIMISILVYRTLGVVELCFIPEDRCSFDVPEFPFRCILPLMRNSGRAVTASNKDKCQMKGSVDIPGMSTYLFFAGNCIIGFSTVRTICLCKNLAKNVENKTCWSFNNQVCSSIFCTSVLIFHCKPCNLTYTVTWCLIDCSVLKNRKNKAGNKTYLLFAELFAAEI